MILRNTANCNDIAFGELGGRDDSHDSAYDATENEFNKCRVALKVLGRKFMFCEVFICNMGKTSRFQFKIITLGRY